MTTYYLPRKESDWLDANGGKDKLLSIVRDAMEGPMTVAEAIAVLSPAVFCPHCNVRLQSPGQSPCFHCGLSTVVD